MPPEIVRPDYVETGNPVRTSESMVKSADVIERMRVAGAIARDVLARPAPRSRPASPPTSSTASRTRRTSRATCTRARSRYRGFPKSVCTSVNEVICHGIPDDRALVDGDIVNIDVTVYVDGVHGDTNATFCVGRVDPVSDAWCASPRSASTSRIEAVRPGAPLHDIGRAIETHAHAEGFIVVQAFVGHGIGEVFHGPPQVPHYYERTLRTIMEPGMVFTIEPMITIGDIRPVIWDDGWTAVTADGSRTAQFEHTVLVTDTGVDVLTR